MKAKPVADFAAESTHGTFRLSDHTGHPVVLYFYPRDNTPGCTTEGQQFRDLYPKFLKAGAVVAGVSRDSLKSHESFSKKMDFPFPLIADPDEALCKQFDVMRMKNMQRLRGGASGGELPRSVRTLQRLPQQRQRVLAHDLEPAAIARADRLAHE